MVITHHTPPKGICKTSKLFIIIFLDKIDNEREKDEAKKTNVNCGDELLEKDQKT
jgi:hypothetical protein